MSGTRRTRQHIESLLKNLDEKEKSINAYYSGKTTRALGTHRFHDTLRQERAEEDRNWRSVEQANAEELLVQQSSSYAEYRNKLVRQRNRGAAGIHVLEHDDQKTEEENQSVHRSDASPRDEYTAPDILDRTKIFSRGTVNALETARMTSLQSSQTVLDSRRKGIRDELNVTGVMRNRPSTVSHVHISRREEAASSSMPVPLQRFVSVPEMVKTQESPGSSEGTHSPRLDYSNSDNEEDATHTFELLGGASNVTDVFSTAEESGDAGALSAADLANSEVVSRIRNATSDPFIGSVDDGAGELIRANRPVLQDLPVERPVSDDITTFVRSFSAGTDLHDVMGVWTADETEKTTLSVQTRQLSRCSSATVHSKHRSGHGRDSSLSANTSFPTPRSVANDVRAKMRYYSSTLETSLRRLKERSVFRSERKEPASRSTKNTRKSRHVRSGPSTSRSMEYHPGFVHVRKEFTVKQV